MTTADPLPVTGTVGVTGTVSVTASTALPVTGTVGIDGTVSVTTGTISIQAVTTDVAATANAYSSVTGDPGDTYSVLDLTKYSLTAVNNSTAGNQAIVKLQISPDGTNWTDDTSYVTLNSGSIYGLVASTYMKYARVYYAAVNAASAVTLNFYFQGTT